jgi:hypothetical protein
MSTQDYNPKVSAILTALSCKTNPGCACVANLSMGHLTHCPICGHVKLWVGEVDGKIKLDPTCGCRDAGSRARDILKAHDIEL